MSAIVAIIDAPETGDAGTGAMLAAMVARGTDCRERWSQGPVCLAIGRAEWELAPGFSGNSMIAHDGARAVAADASIYYRADLRSKLRAAGVPDVEDHPGAYILAAYRAWGPACVDRLEGDFAFALWDGESLFCARDIGGIRPLFYADCGDALVVASTIGGVLAHPRVPRALNLASLAETASALWAGNTETCYQAVQWLHAGHALSRPRAGPPRVTAHWTPPRIDAAGASSFEDGARELRELLVQAVGERLDPDAPSAVWMSAGRDSSAIFGAGQEFLTHRSRPSQRLWPVSISYPPGDPGREDEWIQLISDQWGVPIHWLDIRDIPMMREAEASARSRDEPLAHVYEAWNRALARGTRAVGSRIALSGYGGDQLFSVSNVYLADLLVRGRWQTLAREWNLRRDWGWRAFVRWAVLPSVPAPILQLSAAIRPGRPLRDYLERRLPPWIDPRFAADHGLEERERGSQPGQRIGRRADGELGFYLRCPYFPRVVGVVASLGLAEGVETRSPLYDPRVIEFAARRPREERNQQGETKRLLRAAMRGLLPEDVLAPRARKTGVTTSYFDRSSREEAVPLVEAAFSRPILGDLGIIDVNRLWSSWEEYRKHGGRWGHHLLMTLHTELWLKANAGRAVGDVERGSGGGGTRRASLLAPVP